jgi:hypothetical protein
MKQLKTWGMLLACTILCVHTVTAQQIRPPALTIAGIDYQIIYNAAILTNNPTTATLQTADGPQGQATLYMSPNDAKGTVVLGEKHYKVTITATNTTISELATPPAPPEHSDGIRAPDDRPMPRALNVKAASTEEPTIVDILVVYTPAAQLAVGGESNILSQIQLSVAEANQSYIDSGINVRLNLVHAAKVNYIEAPGSMGDDLARLSTRGDGYLDDATDLQDQYGADVVCLFNSSTDGYSGLGYLLTGTSKLAYSIVQAQWSAGYYTLAHEVGHNFGCAHDRNNSDGYAAFSYSFGNRFYANSFQYRTVMAYAPGMRIGMFSTPLKTFLGTPTGTATEDNARTINERAAYIASIANAPSYTLQLTLNGNGTLYKNGVVTTPGTFTVQRGTPITFSVETNNFLCWSGATNSVATSVQIVLTSNTNLVANFNNGSNPLAPQITLEPTDQTVVTGNDIILKTDGYGIPTPSFTWYFNGTQCGTGKTLTIANATKANQGYYNCTLSNASGTATSHQVNILVGEAPQIIQQPVSQLVQVGGNALFSVITDAAKPTFQWYFNSVAIPSATNRTYNLTAITTANMGNYHVTISIPGFTLTSETAQLLLSSPPVITTQPKRSEVIAGQTTNLTVVAVGVAPLTYQWQKDGANLSGKTSATLTLTNIQSSDAGSYRVQVSNPQGTTSSTNATLVVYNPLVITEQPTNLTANVGATPIFYVKTTGATPTTYQWFGNGKLLTNQVYSSCRLTNVQVAQAGIYYVQIKNPAGTLESREVILTVKDPPVITTQPQTTVADFAGNASFSVTARGKTPMTYTWYHNDATIAGATSSTLNLINATTEDIGNYKVAITNADGYTTSQNASLSLHYPPTITQQPQDTVVNKGNSATLRISADGMTPLTFTWHRTGGALAGTGDTLSIASVQTNNAGGYYVVVSNRLGTVTSQTATITLKDPAKIVSVLNATAVDEGENLTITPTVEGKGPITYSWTKNGSVVSTATKLTISTAKPADAGYYALSVTGPDGGMTSPGFQISVRQLPRITAQPASITTANGNGASFTVTATGEAPLNYYWFFGTNCVSTTNANNFTIYPVSLANEGYYSVLVSNRLGTVTSSNAQLTVSFPPNITVQPRSTSVVTGEVATFSVTATGRQPLTYNWKKGTTLIPNATNNSLAIANLKSSDADNYYVAIVNSDGTLTSAAATLTAIIAPIITVQPQNITANKGGTIRLSASVASAAPVSYTWTFNGTPVANATNSTLTLNDLLMSQAGTYVLVASNIAGSTASRDTTLAIKDPPVFTLQPTNRTVKVGSTMTLRGLATSSRAIAYQWQKGNVDIPGATNPTYTTTVTTTSGGQYALRAANADGTNYSTIVSITVSKEPPYLTNALPPSLTIAPGDTLEIVLPIGGRAPFTIQWYHNNVAIPGQTTNPLARVNFDTNWVGAYRASITNADGFIDTPTIEVRSGAIPPTISSQPQNINVARGASATFRITSGNGTTYQWFKNRNLISGATNATFTINNVQDADEASYSAEITNPYGTTASTTATLAIIDPPTITTQPHDVLFTQGTTIPLSVTATGYGGLGYQWMKNGTNLAGCTQTSLPINNANLQHEGNYSVVISNNGGSTTSRVAIVVMKRPPTITSQPVGLVRKPGDTATFNVTATGRGELSYQWFKGTNAISNATDSALTINNVTYTDATTYWVKISNADGSVQSSIASLAVFNPPTITVQPSNTAVGQGLTLTLNVTATGTGSPTYQWYKDSVKIPGGTFAQYTKSGADAGTAGNYFVIISNPAGDTKSATITVTVGQLPAITVQPTSKAVTLGSAQTLSVSATGTGPLTYYWQKMGRPYKTTSNGILNFASITSSDLATYRVIVSNLVGTATSQNASFSAPTNGLPPGILADPQSLTAVENSTATLKVIANGEQPLTFQWKFNGNPIAGKTQDTLTLTSIGTSHQGNYSVVVSNRNDTIESSEATLTLAYLPHIVAQPTNVTVVEGQTLSVNLTATNATDYRWFHNNAAFASTTNAQLIVENTPTNLTGKLTLVLSNSVGSITSAPIAVTVFGLPKIITQPLNQSPQKGTTVTLSTAVVGTSPFTYQWKKNGVNLSGATAATLTLANIQPVNEANYTVQVSNAYGQDSSSPAYIRVMDAPAFAAHPANTAVNQGATLTLTCTVTGRSPINFVWFKNKVQLSAPSTNKLVIPNAQSSDAGSYYVRASNSDGNASSLAATVTITIAPAITSTTSTLTPNKGASVSLIPVITGSLPMTYQWYRNGTTVSGATSKTLDLSNISTNQEGTYSIMAANMAGGASATVAIITVKDPPVVTTQPASRGVNLGQTATFTVTATGRGPLSYQWYKWSTPIMTGTGPTLEIPNVGTNDLANYSVKITNSDGSTTSATATLSLLQSPTITGGPNNIRIIAGGSATMTVTYAGTAPFSFQWFQDGYPLPGATNATLGFINASAANEGDYHLVIQNNYGSITSSTGTVAILYPPQITASPKSQTVNQGSITTLEVTADGRQPMGYTWYKNGIKLPFTTRIITLVNVQTSDAGGYSVTVTNSDGTAYSSTASLVVKPLPVITSQPQTTIATISNAVQLTVGVISPYAVQYQWLKNGTIIPGANQPTINFTNVQFSDAGTYVVNLASQVGTTVSEPAILLVLPIQPLKIPREQIQPVILQLVAIGNGEMGFLYHGAIGRTYEIQGTTNMVDWETLGTKVPTENINQFIDHDAINHTHRVFRVKVLQ